MSEQHKSHLKVVELEKKRESEKEKADKQKRKNQNMDKGVRMEKDALGTMEIPMGAYYGIQSRRCRENFPLKGQQIHHQLIRAMGLVKYACIRANMTTKSLPEDIGEALKSACQEFIVGKFDEQIIVESIQGGAGTSINMNVNEVLANRAMEMLGYEKGRYDIVSPNTHVNMSQSTNDVVPTAFKTAVLMMEEPLIRNLNKLYSALKDKELAFDDVLTVGRTHLQDALPIRLGQEFGAYARLVQRDIRRIESAMEDFHTVNLGATALGTGLNADPQYIDAAIKELSQVAGLKMQRAEHLMDATQNTDAYVHLSGALRTCGLNLSKMANDLRLLSSGPICGLKEIHLPPMQPGSSIMPGKVNPVMAEMMNQIGFQIQGNDHVIAMASEAGQLQLNVMGPVIFKNLFESMDILTEGIGVLTERCIKGIEVNKEHCNKLVNESMVMITALNPLIGYEKSSLIAKEVLENKGSVREVALEKGFLTEKELDQVLQAKAMTEPGIVGRTY